MTIKQAEQQDCGQYTVKISNKISEVNADFILSMKDKPEPPQGYVYFFSWNWFHEKTVCFLFIVLLVCIIFREIDLTKKTIISMFFY